MEWTRLSSEAFPTRDKAQRFITIMSNQYFGSGKETLTPNSEVLDFKIVEGKNRFYIEYRLLKKHTL